ncbi:MAG: tetratricopeptide repeat protein [Bacteroidota bacterium]|nr:tetratricopeptide repeat protein [Bacteroidota bacterium]
MKSKSILIIGLLLALLPSCNTQERLEKKIHALENSPSFLDTAQQNQLLGLYLKYAHKFPNTENAINFWFHGVQELYYRKNSQKVIQEGQLFLAQYDSTPFHRNMQILLAKSYYKTSQMDSSISFYGKAEKQQVLNSDESQDLALVFLKKEVQVRGDSIGSYFLLRAAKLLIQSQQSSKALEIVDDLLSRYRGTNEEAEALYLKARILEDDGKIALAKKYYSEMVSKFPKHPFSKDVRLILENDFVGLSAEEIFEKIKP